MSNELSNDRMSNFVIESLGFSASCQRQISLWLKRPGSAPGGDLSLGFSHLDFRCEAPGGLSVKGGVMMMTTRRLA